MKLPIILTISAFALLAQDEKANAQPVTSSAKSEVKPIDKDLAAIYESYSLKFELAVRRADDEAARSLEQFKADLEKRKAKVLDDARAALGPQQDAVRARICKSADLPETCTVAQDPKTGEWTASASIAPKKAVENPTDKK
jgi:hypothetical protein